MTIYEVRYICEDSPGGYAYLFFTSKAAAKKAHAQIERNHREAQRKYQAAFDADVEYYDLPPSPGQEPHPEIDTVELKGTCQEMVLQALRHAVA